MALIGTETIGLDIGRTAIKAVRFRRTWNGHESTAYFHRPISGADGKENGETDGNGGGHDSRTARLLKDFFTTHSLSRSNCISTLPCRDIFIRQITLPFQNHTQLIKVVPFEVENLIPLPLEEVKVDYHLLTREKAVRQGVSNVLVAAAPAPRIREHLQLFAAAGIHQPVVDVDVLALFSYFQYHRRYMRLPDHAGIIDIGASKTTICLTFAGRPSFVRTIPWGSDCITEAMTKRYGCSLVEAERKKHEMSAQQMCPSLDALVNELRVSLHSYESTTKMRLRHVTLCGGGTRLRGLHEYVSEQLQLELLTRPGFGPVKCPPEFSVAFGSAVRAPMSKLPWQLRGRKSRSFPICIDFNRRNEQQHSRIEQTKRDWRLHSLRLLVIAMLMFADLSVRLYLAEERVRELKTAIHGRFEEVFPNNISGLDELDQASGALESVKKSLAGLGGNRPTMVETMAGLARRITPHLVRKVTMLTVETESIMLEAETNSFDSVERMKQSLRSMPGVHEATISDARIGEAPNQVLFRVTLNFNKP